MTESTQAESTGEGKPLWQRWLLWVLPLALLGGLLWAFVHFQPVRQLAGGIPPIKDLSIQRVTLDDDGFTAHVINGGPDPVTISQVLVDEAYWDFSVTPDKTLERLERGRVHIPYPWVHGEAHEIELVSSVGLTFSKEVDPAVESPGRSSGNWLMYGLLGLYVGVIPVGLGLLWFPVLADLSRKWMNFILALTVGLLLFLLADTFLEAVELGESVPEAFQSLPLVLSVTLLSFLGLLAVGRYTGAAEGEQRSGRLWLAGMIALGIGLHNLGEGMAIGAAISTGEAALGSFLVIGFTLHNITEGVGIAAPITRDRPGFWMLAGFALLAGAPAIFGTWIGGFSYSPLAAMLFLAVGAGAILQVVWEVGKLLLKRTAGEEDSTGALSWPVTGGVTAGIAVMYATALLVTV